MNVGFIGLGNVGGKLAGSLLRNKFNLTVRDLDKNLTKQFKDSGAKIANSAKELAEENDLIITNQLQAIGFYLLEYIPFLGKIG